MIEYERDITFFKRRGHLHLGVVRILFGEHRTGGWYVRFVPPFWFYRMMNVVNDYAKQTR